MTPRSRGDGVIECWKYSSSPALVMQAKKAQIPTLASVRVVEVAGGMFGVWITGTAGCYVFHGESKIAALTTFANVAMLDDVRPESLLAMGFESFVGGVGQGGRRA